tara:strand:+ start:819 stop:1109 length:291 start_codon:yes stop_codon:yes gene_type:complete
MRLIAVLLSVVLMTMLTVPSRAGHSTGNGTCTDDAVHYQGMTVNGKRSDAPLYAESQAMRDSAIEQKVQGNVAECETLMEEALRMIRKTGGEYPTE